MISKLFFLFTAEVKPLVQDKEGYQHILMRNPQARGMEMPGADVPLPTMTLVGHSANKDRLEQQAKKMEVAYFILDTSKGFTINRAQLTLWLAEFEIHDEMLENTVDTFMRMVSGMIQQTYGPDGLTSTN